MEKRVLQEEPFRTVGSIVELFDDNKEDARAILSIIDEINDNTVEIAGAWQRLSRRVAVLFVGKDDRYDGEM